MTTKEIMSRLKAMGNEGIKNIYKKHGAPDNHYGVKIEDLQKIRKQIKKNYELSLELYDTGNSDAQYLAGLIADETKMTKKDLQHWADHASWHMMNEFTVAWIAAESNHGWELAIKWIDSKKENIQVSGWSTLASLVSLKPDKELNIKELRNLLKQVEKQIHSAGNRVKYAMNTFLISTGGYVKELTEEALKMAKSIGQVTVDMGDTSCKVPYASDYIQKMLAREVKKKKMARC